MVWRVNGFSGKAKSRWFKRTDGMTNSVAKALANGSSESMHVTLDGGWMQFFVDVERGELVFRGSYDHDTHEAIKKAYRKAAT